MRCAVPCFIPSPGRRPVGECGHGGPLQTAQGQYRPTVQSNLKRNLHPMSPIGHRLATGAARQAAPPRSHALVLQETCRRRTSDTSPDGRAVGLPSPWRARIAATGHSWPRNFFLRAIIQAHIPTRNSIWLHIYRTTWLAEPMPKPIACPNARRTPLERKCLNLAASVFHFPY
jgi:hypothetical protein